ncbi:2-oxoacid:acceptor oxidoreductase subunit alpha [Litorilinea aerophila]|uniref:2-oxoacid:acceptor oxidoreductase subunit alpha n=2 Tax=Litorilinea aerophila TaxID=1204385 RepID=A0A540VKX1_9CHLR|nr:2-oxoacid:acceptor oxidoreductase subunit alpha [Litorilinea aerophila]MCC9075088.1 2-oxoacid:acceptor oxidoreductase subunit alpha [Litorilinea aerophila]GIV79877.1 MAG: pyruvate ferredoxin oxidoreductase [Litorilinea sp.]
MSVMVQEAPSEQKTELVVNDFNINVATVNGSGSQTSNNVLIRSLFKMGIPVTGKNFFPSNIQGLPTWYNVRLSKDGYLARRDGIEVLVAMNGATVAEDMASVSPGGIILYDDTLPIAARRHDVKYYPMPVKELVKQADLPFNLRDYVANMVYVGYLAYLLEIDLEEIRNALAWNFGNKTKPIEMNYDMVMRAYQHAKEHVVNDQPYRVARMSGYNEDKILVDGNTAAALGALYNGVNLVSWYPITPSSSLAEAVNAYAPKLRRDPKTGKATYAIIQAEDELAAIGMVVGAGWAGARAMTATSGPGISLMAEFVGLAYFAEIPAVIWDIQRMGPSTGLPTRTSQGDILSAYYLSHGDTRHVVLFPATPAECFDFAGVAFDLAERLQTPVFVLSDLDLGMNLWISDRFTYPEKPMDRGKVLDEEALQKLGGSWGRYKDLDGDGIPYRTLPGNKHKLAAYFTRGTGHNEYAIYSERPDDWEHNLERIHRKFETARTLVPEPIIDQVDGAQVAILSLGSNDPAVAEARDRLRAAGVETSYLRLRALPHTQSVRDFMAAYDRVFVVENNYDGQLCQILASAEPDLASRLVSVARCNGLPLSARWIADTIRQHLDGDQAA